MNEEKEPALAKASMQCRGLGVSSKSNEIPFKGFNRTGFPEE